MFKNKQTNKQTKKKTNNNNNNKEIMFKTTLFSLQPLESRGHDGIISPQCTLAPVLQLVASRMIWFTLNAHG